MNQARKGKEPGHPDVVRLLEAHFKQYPNGIKPVKVINKLVLNKFLKLLKEGELDKAESMLAFMDDDKGESEAISILRAAGKNIMVPDKNGRTLVYIAAENGHVPVINALKAAGTNVNTPDNDGRTPVYIAAAMGHAVAVTALKAAGANVNTAKSDGTTPVYKAAENGYAEAIAALKSAGANVNSPKPDGLTPVYAAAENGYAEAIAALKSAGANVNTSGNDGFTPVYIAARKGHSAAITALKAAGANMDKPVDGFTPVYVAAEKGHAGTIAALHAAGANMDTPIKNGDIPIGIAAEKGRVAVVAALLEAGADASIKTKFGTALEQAKQGKEPGHPEILRLLKAHFKQYPNGIKPENIMSKKAFLLAKPSNLPEQKNSPAQVSSNLNPSGVQAFSPIEESLKKELFAQGQKILFQEFLEKASHIEVKHRSCFISYAWEDVSTMEGKKANEELQAWLERLSKDLKKVGIKVFLDIRNMQGEMQACMTQNIVESDYILLIGTPKYKTRAAQATNVAFELEKILEKVEKGKKDGNNNILLPLLYSGDFGSSFPEGITKNLVRDFRVPENYYAVLAGDIKPLGLIPDIYPELDENGRYHSEYSALFQNFSLQVKRLSDKQPQKRGSIPIDISDKKEESEKIKCVLERLRALFSEEREDGAITENYARYNEYLKKAHNDARLDYKAKQNKHVLYVNDDPLYAEAAAKEISKMIKALSLQPTSPTSQPVFNLSLPAAPKPNLPEQNSPPGPAMLAQFNQIAKPSPTTTSDLKDLKEFLRLVAEGEQDKAEAMLKSNPALVLVPGDVTDLSRRTFRGITGFQYAVWALDWHMWTMLRKYLPAEAAREQAQDFEIGSWVEKHGVHANLNILIQAYQTTSDLYKASKYAEGDTAWVQQVGGAQFLLPAHVINEYCHPTRPFYPIPNFKDAVALPRSRTIDEGEFFTAKYAGGKLGEKFACYRGQAGMFEARDQWRRFKMHDHDSILELTSNRADQREELIAELRLKSTQKLVA